MGLRSGYRGADVYEHLGNVYEAKGMGKEALQYWEKAFELNPIDQDTKRKIEKYRGSPALLQKKSGAVNPVEASAAL